MAEPQAIPLPAAFPVESQLSGSRSGETLAGCGWGSRAPRFQTLTSSATGRAPTVRFEMADPNRSLLVDRQVLVADSEADDGEGGRVDAAVMAGVFAEIALLVLQFDQRLLELL